jgi:putative multicomponent Na+:H+ antiporter subunit B
MTEWIDLFIIALLPLTALFTVVQTQPYYALLLRGILGTVAVLFYAVLGAPDVALTEALVGTLLAVILYAITVRSTQILRVGRLTADAGPEEAHPLRRFCSRYRLSLRFMDYADGQALTDALKEGKIDAVHAKRALLSAHIPGLLPDVPDDRYVVAWASHGRWHERRMREAGGDADSMVRLDAPAGGGG